MSHTISGEVIGMTLGENLKRLRKDRGLSQDEAARKLFLSRQSVSKWELDRSEPGVENLKALSRLYGATWYGWEPNAALPLLWVTAGFFAAFLTVLGGNIRLCFREVRV